jgi:hypothetical protein
VVDHGETRRITGHAPITWMLRPIMRAWLASIRPRFARIPVPHDDPRAHASGPDPIRVFMVGHGPLLGLGVSSNELALPGQVARHLAARTSRGTDVTALPSPQITVTNAVELIGDRPLRGYHLILVFLGFDEALALMPPAQWESGLERLMRGLRSAAPTAQVLFVSPNDIRSVNLFNSRLGLIADRHAEMLADIAKGVVAHHDGVHWMDLEARRAGVDLRYLRPDDYSVWGAAIADRMTPIVPTVTPESSGATKREAEHEQRAAAEERRVLAVERFLQRSAESSPELERVVGLAQRMFNTAGAAITLVGRERQWVHTSTGANINGDGLPRELSICAHTIEQDEVMVVPDLSHDARFDHSPITEAIRFYAGYPLVSPDGQRIGALCVFDPQPRQEQTVDPNLLREVGMFAQRTLWDMVGPNGPRS